MNGEAIGAAPQLMPDASEKMPDASKDKGEGWVEGGGGPRVRQAQAVQMYLFSRNHYHASHISTLSLGTYHEE
jgi:hypothetical protein